MIRKLFILYLFCVPFLGFSLGKESLPSVWIIKDSVSDKIHPDSVQLLFKLDDAYGQLMIDQHSLILQVKSDGKRRNYTITNDNRTFQMTLAKGRHHLEFYINVNFEIIYLDQDFTGGHYYEFGLNFKGSFPARRDIMVEKPVIYLYTEREEPFRLKIKTDAELQFTYPAYKGEWKGTTSPDGTIQINGSNYPYLFWDAQLPVEKLDLNWHQSDQILGTQTIQYLSAQLDNMGFLPKEKADFITYWGPRMQKMNYLQVLWIQNESVNEVASLNISPKFTQNRIYMVFKEISDLTDETLQLKLKSLTPFIRTGNYLVEWGGIEIPSNL